MSHHNDEIIPVDNESGEAIETFLAEQATKYGWAKDVYRSRRRHEVRPNNPFGELPAGTYRRGLVNKCRSEWTANHPHVDCPF